MGSWAGPMVPPKSSLQGRRPGQPVNSFRKIYFFEPCSSWEAVFVSLVREKGSVLFLDIAALVMSETCWNEFLSYPEDIVGRKLKTSVTARKPIQARHLKPKWLVEEDDEVVIQNQAGGISVDMVGLALENGQYGEWIKVQNGCIQL